MSVHRGNLRLWPAGLAALSLLATPVLFGQYPPNPGALGGIQGRVLHSRTGEPMRRVQVILQPADGKVAPVATLTDDTGRFIFTKLPSGRYSLSAKRPGFLPAGFAETVHTRLPVVFPLLAGEELKSIIIRLQPAGVISGAIRFTDGEPAVRTLVQLYQEYFFRSRHGFRKAGSAYTDDRGEYRIYGLPPGIYYLVAAYSPPGPGAGVREQPRLGPDGKPLPVRNFVATYYPSTTTLAEAQPLALVSGGELNHRDIFLARTRTVRLRGRVVSGVSGRLMRGANIRLRQPSPAAGVLIDVPVSVRVLRNGDFEILNVTPGYYTLAVTGMENGRHLTGRQPLTVAGNAVNNVEITLEPYSILSGKVVLNQAANFPLSNFQVSLEPHSDSAPVTSVSVAAAGTFSAPYVPGETYDIFLLDGPPEAYLKSIRIGGFDILRTGFKAEGGPLPAVELMVSMKGARISGEVSDGPTKVALGATVVLIPDPVYGRVQDYHSTSTNEYGWYQFQGVAPGRYTLASWWDKPPCEIYNLESLDACREAGVPVTVRESEQKMVDVKLFSRAPSR